MKKKNETAVGLIIYATREERRFLHAAAARCETEVGSKMSTSQFVLDSAMEKAKNGDAVHGEAKKPTAANPSAHLQVYCTEKERHLLHHAADLRKMSGSDFVLLAALERASEINSKPCLAS
jgi:uncharacterized protein (DUF1778 family)